MGLRCEYIYHVDAKGIPWRPVGARITYRLATKYGKYRLIDEEANVIWQATRRDMFRACCSYDYFVCAKQVLQKSPEAMAVITAYGGLEGVS